jgi:hypothetical protein
MTEPTSTGREWRVRLDLPLDQEQHDQVTRAIQSAVLGVVAEFDIASEYSIRLVGPASRAHLLRDSGNDPFGQSPPDLGVPDGAVMRLPEDPLAAR